MTVDKPPGHTCPAINQVQHVLRQIIWRMDNPDRQTLEQVRTENAQMRSAYYTMRAELAKHQENP